MKQPMQVAMDVIRGEHRTLAAVMESMKALIAGAAVDENVDFALLWTMLYYIEVYPDRLHHPKEELHIFDRLRRRTEDAAELVNELERQHEDGIRALAGIRTALGHLEARVAGAREALSATLQRYSEQMWKHMSTEEQKLLPLAATLLDEQDWQQIAAAFSDNQDPLIGQTASADLATVFRRIVESAPAPIGLGGR